MKGWINDWKNKCMDSRMDGWKNELINEWMDKETDAGWINQWLNELINEWRDEELMNEWWIHICLLTTGFCFPVRKRHRT